jgi:hypothetical protein
MKKLDEILKCGWKVEINIGNGGIYFINASHYQYSPIYTFAGTIQGAISDLYKKIWKVTK